VIEQQGYSAATMARVAEVAGVSEGTVYNYFKDKQTLLDAVLEAWAMPVILAIEAVMEARKTPSETLRDMAIVHLDAMRRTPEMHLMFYREGRWVGYLGSRIHALNKRYVTAVMDTFHLARQQGLLAPSANAELARDMFFGSLEHLGVRTILAKRSLDIPAAASELVDQLLMGIVKSQSIAVSLGKITAHLETIGRQVAQIDLMSRPLDSKP